MDSTASADDILALEARLDALQEASVDGFDPVRFRFMEALLVRARGHREGVSHILARRLTLALDEYHCAYCAAKEKATLSLARGTTQFPESRESLQALFDSNQFDALRRLLLKLELVSTAESLAHLAKDVASGGDAPDGNSATGSFDDILRQQEHTLLSKAGPSSTALPAHGFVASGPSGEGELDAIHYFRESLVKRNADKLVTQAIKEIPEGAGPLNPQKLIVQSLSSMRDLSPHYLNRFVAYIDTLLWLEKAGRKL